MAVKAMEQRAAVRKNGRCARRDAMRGEGERGRRGEGEKERRGGVEKERRGWTEDHPT
jgi:hypothetical protein